MNYTNYQIYRLYKNWRKFNVNMLSLERDPLCFNTDDKTFKELKAADEYNTETDEELERLFHD